MHELNDTLYVTLSWIWYRWSIVSLYSHFRCLLVIMRLPTVAWLTCSLTRHLTLRVQQFWGWHTYLHLGLTLVEMEESALLV